MLVSLEHNFLLIISLTTVYIHFGIPLPYSPAIFKLQENV